MKICKTCKKEKAEVEFYKHEGNLDNLSFRCKKCTSVYFKNLRIKKLGILGIDRIHKAIGVAKSKEARKKMSLAVKARYASGWKHPMLGKKLSEEHKDKYLKNDKNPMWKGEKVSYGCLHRWLRRNYPPPDKCPNCGWKKPRLEVACLTGKYSRNPKDYTYLCVKCHRNMDNYFETFRFRKKFHARFGI
jgi:hypothetical protein